ncbi:MAG: 5'/3'-nucleotidase SurE [Armatimonadetes bacterium RBG_16_58_9]|nr:MAG: 5'/3'-nucleotidase SurE [Armatimonadetes bacterium RBG_16_58_9]
MEILITNDDGIHSQGLIALKTALDPVGRVHVVAPDRPRSACGHSITLHKPLRADKVRLADSSVAYSTNGTPSDCISLGILGILDRKVDLVVSGINRGPNLGWDLTYSGTVSAAMEGAIMGAQSFAISVATSEQEVDYDVAAAFAARIARTLAEHELPESTLLNINVPGLPASEIRGVIVTRQGRRRYLGNVEKRSDPTGRDYYWLGGDLPEDQLVEGTDVKAIADDMISVTPVHLDLTDYQGLEAVRSWGIESSDLESILSP